MNVILRSDVKGLGKRGDVVSVSDGHARNYLLPHGLAIGASDGAVAQAAAMRKARDNKERASREAALQVASRLGAATVSISAKAGNEGRLFGSVTST
jgi:large subunit ribosomal protein L9